MLLPNTDSFTLRRGSGAPFPEFLPNADSFILIRQSTVKLSFPSEAVVATSTEAVVAVSAEEMGSSPVEPVDSDQQIKDRNKRNFLKLASMVGTSVIVSQLTAPDKAHALIMGSSPTSGVVGVKNAANTRINPATEETVSSLLKPSDLTFDTGALKVKVTSVSGPGSSSFSDAADVPQSGLVSSNRHVQVDVLNSALPTSASTETTLQTISFGGYKFTLRLDTVGSVDYIGEASIGTVTSSSSWRIKKVDSTSGIIIQWAGTGVFDQVWDNRATLSYS